MKRILTILPFLLTIQCLSAQINYTPTGTWKQINGTDTIEMFFKTDQILVGTTMQPIVIGFHKYVKNGTLIESTLEHVSTNYSNKKFSIIIFNFKENDARNDGNMRDITLNYKRYFILTKLDPTNMKVRLTSMQSRNQTGGVGYTLPRNFQLTRQ